MFRVRTKQKIFLIFCIIQVAKGSWNIWYEVSTFLDFCLFVFLRDTNFDFFVAICKYFNFVEFSKALLALVTLWFCSAFNDIAVYKEVHILFSPFEY
jgi:hypothetical protein